MIDNACDRSRRAARVFRSWPLDESGHWDDFTVRVAELPAFTRRFAGRVETGDHGISDPAMAGPVVSEQAPHVLR